MKSFLFGILLSVLVSSLWSCGPCPCSPSYPSFSSYYHQELGIYLFPKTGAVVKVEADGEEYHYIWKEDGQLYGQLGGCKYRLDSTGRKMEAVGSNKESCEEHDREHKMQKRVKFK